MADIGSSDDYEVLKASRIVALATTYYYYHHHHHHHHHYHHHTTTTTTITTTTITNYFSWYIYVYFMRDTESVLALLGLLSGKQAAKMQGDFKAFTH